MPENTIRPIGKKVATEHRIKYKKEIRFEMQTLFPYLQLYVVKIKSAKLILPVSYLHRLPFPTDP